MSAFNYNTALRHYQRIKEIVEEYRHHKIMVLGDFNIYDVVWTPDDEDENVFLPYFQQASMNTTKQSQSIYHVNALDFLDKMLSLTLWQISNIKNDCSNVLDLVFVNTPSEISMCEDNCSNIEKYQQDSRHIPYEINVDYSVKSSCNVELKTIRCYARGNYDRLSAQIESINFQHEFMTRDVNAAYEFFVSTVKQLIDQNVPKITVTEYTNKPKWWTLELQRLKNRWDKLFKRKGDAASTIEYEKALTDFNKLNDRLYNVHSTESKTISRRIQRNSGNLPKSTVESNSTQTKCNLVKVLRSRRVT